MWESNPHIHTRKAVVLPTGPLELPTEHSGFKTFKCVIFSKYEVTIVPAAGCTYPELLFRQSFPKLASLRKSAKHNRLGALHWRKAERSDREVRVRFGLDTGFMALDSIYAYIFYIHVTTMHLVRKNDTFKCFKTRGVCWEFQWACGYHHRFASVNVWVRIPPLSLFYLRFFLENKMFYNPGERIQNIVIINEEKIALSEDRSTDFTKLGLYIQRSNI